MHTKRISVESTILGRRENIRVDAFACLLIELLSDMLQRLTQNEKKNVGVSYKILRGSYHKKKYHKINC